MGGFMKRIVVLSFLIIVTLSGVVQASESPVTLSHSLTSSSKGDDSVTLNFTLHIENISDTPLNNLRLEHVPLMLFATEEIILKVEKVDANSTFDIPFTLVIPVIVDEEEILRQPLFWAGEGIDANNFIEFPAESHLIK
jgi:hypothetical protein